MVADGGVVFGPGLARRMMAVFAAAAAGATTTGPLAELTEREREVLSLRFGLGGRGCLSLSQVGKVLGVSKERIRQIQDRAIEKLRTLAEGESLMNRLDLSV